MTFTPHGKHLIAGHWVKGDETAKSSPSSGTPHAFSIGTPAHADAAVQAAEEAFAIYGYSSREDRAAFLNRIADEIELRGADLTKIGCDETGLPAARLEGERARTTGQLRLFATHILDADYLDRRHDKALPDRAPLPRPDLRLIQRPIGPVAVFGASNFPLAFSTAGGDTASALAAGCPVVVKGHPAHPGTSEIVAEAILAAVVACGVHKGVFSMIQDGGHALGQALVQNPLINAVGFTGSLHAGRALFDLCARRPTPIPFFGELGSVNPMFILPMAEVARGAEIGSQWAASLTMGAGQFCTNPGVAVVLEDGAHAFIEAAKTALSQTAPQTMLTDGIAAAYRQGKARVAATGSVEQILNADCDQRNASPALYATTGDNWLATRNLAEEVFGPLGIVVLASNTDQIVAIARALDGQLTCTLHMEETDTALAAQLLPILERKAGRILCNGFPTGVEVSDAMVHGGPYPASTNFGATSVGTMAIRRFLRPVCYQNIPEVLLPTDLQAMD